VGGSLGSSRARVSGWGWLWTLAWGTGGVLCQRETCHQCNGGLDICSLPAYQCYVNCSCYGCL